MSQRKWIKLSLALGFILAGETFAQDPRPVVDDPVQAFKRQLGAERHVVLLVYTDYAPGTNPRHFAAACKGADFCIRELPGLDGINAGNPLDTKSSTPGMLLAGRSGNICWQINGNNVGQVEATPTHPYALHAEAMKMLLNGALNFGPQSIIPGSFHWNDNKFEAQTADALAKTAPQFATNTGAIRMEKGRVAELATRYSGTFRYKYDSNSRLPAGFPSEVLTQTSFNHWDTRIKYHRFEAFDESPVATSEFLPDRFIDPEKSVPTLVSNGVVVLEADSTNPEIVRRVAADVAGRSVSITNRPPWLAIIAGVATAAVGIACVVAKFRRT
ncbi:MAG TPA: hypothetical protein VMF06_05605 [Candidatus Limnocylindria bacterium]|nr:hypothetical protein [Candidatus Limnocylindria bacterium]